MDQLDRNELSQLVDARHDVCVSIYMPTHRKGPEVQQGPSRLKNLLKRAEKEAERAGIKPATIAALLAPARALLTEVEFWNHQADGLALFLVNGSCKTIRLPIAFDEICSVSYRFHVKPLLPLVGRDGGYHVLAVSQKRVRVFSASRFDIRELQPNGVPASLAEVLRFDDFEKSLQSHTTGGSPGGRSQVAFHGQGAAEDDNDQRLRTFFREIDRGLGDLLAGDNAPLVLAGVEYYLPIYREANTYPHLLDKVVAGNPDALGKAELHARTWAIVEPLFAAKEEQIVSRYRQLVGTGRTADDPATVVAAARNGQVDSLLVALDKACWGEISPEGEVTVHDERRNGDRDLLDAAVAATLRNGGTAFARSAAHMPNGASAAALLRD